jgi:hypothetical protein
MKEYKLWNRLTLLYELIYIWLLLSGSGSVATNRKVAGSIPDEVIRFFNLPNISSRTGVDSASNRNEYQESSWG